VEFDPKVGRFSAGEALLYASRDDQVTDFAAKVLWLLDHPEQRERMGQIARKRVQEALGWKYSVPYLLDAYDRAFSN
jgi:glycosyltransferase involved in cell wall biosynthesis